jgi:hypothetical protein
MSEEELENYRSLIFKAVGIGSAAVLLLALFSREATPEGKFEVVDQYQGCNVVRYVDPSNGWNYFLDCRQR